MGHPELEGTAVRVGIPFRIGASRNHPQGTCCIPCVPRTRPLCDSLEQAQTLGLRLGSSDSVLSCNWHY